MFKSSRWGSDKNKIKAVFKLQFHATQLSQIGGDGLMISVIPSDIGKPSAKLEKAKVKDGSCYWQKPHLETVKFVQDPKTGKIHEKIYHFGVATGSSKFGVVGEVSIDFASYAEATKVSSVSLPLNSAALLHVLIQRVQDSVDQRIVDGSETASPVYQDRSLRAQFRNGDSDGSIKSHPTQDGSLNGAISHVSDLIGNRRASSGSDITLSSSGSSSGFDEIKNESVQKPNHVSSATIYEERQSSQWDWLEGPAPELSTDDSSISPRDDNTLLTEISGDGSYTDIVIKKLKTELASLSRQVDMSELELQTLRKQIVKESKKGQDLATELVDVKEERNAFKEECEKLKASQKRAEEIKDNDKLLIEEGDPWALIQELREELNYVKDLNSNLRIQLRKTQESNNELILAVRDLDEMLEQKKMESSSLSGNVKLDANDDDEEQKALEEIVKGHCDTKESYLLEQKIMDLYGEVEFYRRDKDEIEMQMEQLALDYEILKQENHDISYKLEQSQVQEQLKLQYECSSSYATVNELENQIEKLENELKIRTKEFSDSLVMIKELETRVKDLEEEFENQAQGFEADLEDLMRKKVEQEQRAIRTEETLRKTRSQNAKTAEKLQEEFRRLSMQMTSTFDANEQVAIKALNEANELRREKSHLEEMLEKSKEDMHIFEDRCEAKLQELLNQISLKTTRTEKMQKLIEDQKTLIQGLTDDKRILEIDLEKMKASIRETEKLLERTEVERKKLETEVSLAKISAESSMEDLNNLRGVKDEKESLATELQLELENLRAHYSELKHSSMEDGVEREKLGKQVSQLKGDLQRKEDAFTSIEKKLKDKEKTASRNNRTAPAARSSKEVTHLKEQIKQLEGQIKLKETALQNSENSFLEKEKKLQHKIEELERRMEILDQSHTTIDGHEFHKLNEETRNTEEDPSSMRKSNEAISLDNGVQGDLDALSNEMALLKKKNLQMEGELKEMQERYSEISLKFAEVEGERQQLVMTLRNLKNTKKF